MPLVKLYANLRTLAGAKEVAIAGRSVRGLLTELVGVVPALASAIPVEGDLGGRVVLILNGRNVTDLDTAVGADDVLAIFPPIAGG